jgi:nitroreductase
MTMDTMEAILTRRSIRKYAPKPVDEQAVTQLLKAAMAAPSAGNEQAWHFVVITDRAILDDVPKFHEYAQMLYDARLAVLVCGDARLEKCKDYWVQDCSAATQNLLLAAHALGLGAVWLGMYPVQNRVDGMRKLLGIPKEVTPFALISIGHPAEHKPPAERYDPQRIHYNNW